MSAQSNAPMQVSAAASPAPAQQQNKASAAAQQNKAAAPTVPDTSRDPTIWGPEIAVTPDVIQRRLESLATGHTHSVDKVTPMITKLTIKKPKLNKATGRVKAYVNPLPDSFSSVRLLLNGGDGTIEDALTRPIRAQFGAQDPKEKKDNTMKNMDVTITNPATGGTEGTSLHEFAKKIDEHSIDYIHEHAVEWFKKPRSKEVLEERYGKMLRPWKALDENGKAKSGGPYDPTVRIKIPMDSITVLWHNGFDANKKALFKKGKASDLCSSKIGADGKAIPPSLSCVIVADFTGYWFSKEDFGPSLQANLIILKPKSAARASAAAQLGLNIDNTPMEDTEEPAGGDKQESKNAPPSAAAGGGAAASGSAANASAAGNAQGAASAPPPASAASVPAVVAAPPPASAAARVPSAMDVDME